MCLQWPGNLTFAIMFAEMLLSDDASHSALKKVSCSDGQMNITLYSDIRLQNKYPAFLEVVLCTIKSNQCN